MTRQTQRDKRRGVLQAAGKGVTEDFVMLEESATLAIEKSPVLSCEKFCKNANHIAHSLRFLLG